MPLEQAPTLGELESAAETARGVLAEMVGKGEEPAKPEKIDAPPPETAPAETAAETAAAAEKRARDEKGRFVAKEGEAEAPKADARPAKVVTEPIASARGQEPVVAADVPDELLEPLPEWSAADHEAFRALPPAQQKFILDKAQAAAKAAEEAQSKYGRYAPLDEILGPRRQHLAINGLDDIAYVKQLTALSDFAANDPAAFARWFIQNRGIAPEQIWPADGGIEQQMDPAVQALRQELDSLKGLIQTQQRTSESSVQQQLQTDLSKFRDARDSQGRLEHPYFEQVRRHMGGLMGAGVAPDLTTAYDMACRADPEVSAKMASAQRARDEAERARQNRAKAAAASKAGASVSGTPADRPPPDDSGDPREIMRRLAAEKGLLS